MKSPFTAPSPEVQHLTTLFRKIEAGDVRIPAFQREFVWTEAQVLALLESVVKGYPIGSLLLWKVESAFLKPHAGTELPFPHPPMKLPTSFVLDGMQRLCSLYGALNFQPGMSSIFRVVYDLKSQQFSRYDPTTLPVHHIELSALLSPKAFLETTQSLVKSTNADEYISQALQLQRTFQEYLIPTVTISTTEVEDVIQIFQRINSTGTRLSAVDFMRALTWSEAFDLTAELEQLEERIASATTFELEQETLAKVLAIAMGRDPVAESMYTLKGSKATELREGVLRAERAIERALWFLREEFGVWTKDFVPYEGQILVLASVFMEYQQLTQVQRGLAKSWFLSSTLNESMRGRPDNFIAREIRSVRTGLQTGNSAHMRFRVDLTPAALLDRRLIRGKALTTGMLIIFAVHEARSLVTNDKLDAADFMYEFNAERYVPILSANEVSIALGKPIFSARTFANVVVDDGAIPRKADESIAKYILELNMNESKQIPLASQFLDARAMRFLAEGRHRDFLQHRAAQIAGYGQEVVSAWTGAIQSA